MRAEAARTESLAYIIYLHSYGLLERENSPKRVWLNEFSNQYLFTIAISQISNVIFKQAIVPKISKYCVIYDVRTK